MTDKTLEQEIIEDLGDEDILRTVNDTDMLLKPKGKQAKPKHTKVLSPQEIERRTAILLSAVKKRSDETKLRKEKELDSKAEQMKKKLLEIEEKKNQIQKIKESKAKPVTEQPESKKESKAQPKSSKKKVKVVIEQSSSDSDDYASSASSSSEEVVYVSKKKQSKKQADAKPITKPKEEPSKPQQSHPSCVFKFV